MVCGKIIYANPPHIPVLWFYQCIRVCVHDVLWKSHSPAYLISLADLADILAFQLCNPYYLGIKYQARFFPMYRLLLIASSRSEGRGNDRSGCGCKYCPVIDVLGIGCIYLLHSKTGRPNISGRTNDRTTMSVDV